MSKLTNAEKDKLDNTCGNLRVTKLGTHVKTLEDFVNEGVLDTRANTVVEAINELYGMIVNKDCEGITIPPPGFFTLFGNDEDGKLYVYYNNADYPPQFRHVETPGELEGTLYLYIADPLGENHYELEVGHYIAVRHLDNYYTKAQINSMFTVTVEKQTTAESGSFATYVVKQGGNQVGTKINIPKDYLVKSCSVKSCTTANVPVQGYKVGDKYIDWVINTRDGSATNEHLYLLVNEIVEPYKADNSTVTLSSGNVFSVKDGGITLVKLAPAVQTLINGKADANHAHGNITKEGKVGTTPNVPLITGTDGVVQAGSFGSGANNFARGNHGHSDLASIAYVDHQIASVEGDVVIDLESKADRDDPRLSDKRSPKTNFIDVSSTNPVDLNTIREIGFYCTMSNTGAQYVSNCPYSSTGSAPFTNNKMFYLLVEALGSGSDKPYVKQTLTYHNSNSVWVRTKNGGDADDANWSSWEKISLEGHTHQLNDVGLTKIGANADFETYKQQGFYYIDNTNAQSSTNMPFKTGGLLIVRNLVGGVSQTFQRYNGTDMWYKTYSNGEDQWSNWNKICFVDHTHGNISNTGAIGSTANLPVITTTSGKLTTGSFGTSANTFCQGNDPRLSDKRRATTTYIDVSSTNPVDLNTIRENGFYCTMSNTGAQYVSNCPYSSTGSAPFTNNKMFYLLVEALGSGSDKPYVKQTLTYHNSNSVWVRTKNGGDADGANWSGWNQLIKDDDSRLSDARTPTSHNHGNLQNNGQVGTTVQADKPLITDSNGKIKIGIFGNGSKTFCEGNDSRITNSVNTACKIGFALSGSSTTPATSLEFSTTSGQMMYAFVRNANGEIPSHITKGYMVVNGSFQSKTVASDGSISAYVNVKSTYLIEAGFFDANGWVVCSATCKVTVS